MLRRRVALVAAWSVIFAGPILVGPATSPALAHSQLVTSVPAAGEVVPSGPSQLRLVFSEPIEATYTKLDLLDKTGKTLLEGVGAPDPADAYSLVASLPKLADGIYTVNWRALSAADGHTTSGFFTFGVGNVAPPPVGSAADTGSIHAGHDAATAFLETESRIAGDLGLLLAFGLPIIGWLVLKGPRSTGLAKVIAASLALALVGAIGLIVLGGIGIGVNPLAYVGDSRTGQLLLARAAMAAIGVVLILALLRRRAPVAVVIGGLAGLAGLVFVAAGGHAAAYDSPAPVAAVVVHLAAASVWLSGILVLAWLTIGGAAVDRPLSLLVPRFSALALVSVGLVALSGIYSDWIQTRSLVSLDTPYSATLAVKIALAAAAFTIGAFNYFSGGRDLRFRPRVVAESGLALAVVIATGILASGSPPAQQLPVEIAAVPSSVAPGAAASTLALAPGRPGPTQFVATAPAADVAVAGATVELQLQRLDEGGDSRLALHPGPAPGSYEAGGGLLPADSQWDASVVVHDAGGGERSRTRFAFALDAEGVSAGRATPPVDPAIIVGVVLLMGGALGIAFGLGGGTLPRVDPAASRAAVVAGSIVAAILGGLVLFGGPRL